MILRCGAIRAKSANSLSLIRSKSGSPVTRSPQIGNVAVFHPRAEVDTPFNLVVRHFPDTGIGMSQSQIDEIWEEEPDAYRKQRIGRYAIKNIRERLERRYKEDFILEIKSEVGKGTTVILELPCEEK